jgi:RuvB-like protein 1 (pontin 52)
MSAQLTDITMDAAPAPAVTPIAQPTSAAANRDSRIHTHSHIKGLGLGPDGSALPISQGFVGQTQAREALGIHLGLLREGRYSGRPLLLVGPPGTGKVSRARIRPKGDDERGDPQPRPRHLVSSRAKRESLLTSEARIRCGETLPSAARTKDERSEKTAFPSAARIHPSSEARTRPSSVASIPSGRKGRPTSSSAS